MKNLLSIFGKMDNSEIVSKLGILNKPGDRLEARITDSNRRVVKVQTDNEILNIAQRNIQMELLWKQK